MTVGGGTLNNQPPKRGAQFNRLGVEGEDPSDEGNIIQKHPRRAFLTVSGTQQRMRTVTYEREEVGSVVRAPRKCGICACRTVAFKKASNAKGFLASIVGVSGGSPSPARKQARNVAIRSDARWHTDRGHDDYAQHCRRGSACPRGSANRPVLEAVGHDVACECDPSRHI
jgi:hypothetical protein